MVVSGTEFHRKWAAQCEAAKQIKQAFRHRQRAGMSCRGNFIEAADRYAQLAQEVPDFLDGIRGVFSLEETGDYVHQLELTRPLSPPQRRALRAIALLEPRGQLLGKPCRQALTPVPGRQ